MATQVKDKLQQLSPVQSTMLGASAGVITKLMNYPLLHWKNASQQSKPISFDPRVVYRGLPMACLNLGGSTAVQFFGTNIVQKALTKGGSVPMTQTLYIASAFCGGIISAVPCSMWELTMIQQQNTGGSVPATVRQLFGMGLATPFRGLVMTAGRESLYTMAMLGLCPTMQEQLKERFQMDSSLALAAGALSTAFFSATITHPMDTIKTCMQGDVHQTKYKGIMDTGNLLVEEYGVAKGLFKGLHWRIALITTTFFIVNETKVRLAPVMFPE